MVTKSSIKPLSRTVPVYTSSILTLYTLSGSISIT
nr:MAG TPA: hypothetical protein [Caudoviricetes sp.]